MAFFKKNNNRDYKQASQNVTGNVDNTLDLQVLKHQLLQKSIPFSVELEHIVVK